VLVPSLDNVRRTIAAETAYRRSRLAVLEAIPGNPVGVASREPDDGLVATMARYLPVFNSVTGLRAGHEPHIEPLVQWYRDAGVDAQFELVPGEHDAALGRELARFGYFHSGFHTSLVAAPGSSWDRTTSTPIEQITTPAVLEEFLDVYVAGWGVGDSEGFKANVRPWLTQPGWHLYLARLDGRPAAMAILYLHERVGYFADATTHPDCRGRGLQRALLERRAADAYAAGADLVCSGADYLSTSHRNMERAGLRVQFTRALWRALEPPA
jgi:ribosomal protein S18 acetylase RimI-like enzyme